MIGNAHRSRPDSPGASSRATTLTLACAWLLALAGAPPVAASGTPAPFYWNRDSLFQSLEQGFEQSRRRPLADVQREFESVAALHKRALAALPRDNAVIPRPLLRDLEESQFRLAMFAAAHEPLLPEAQRLITETRLATVQAARRWPAERPDVHELIYRVVYGGRTALEEALVQQRVGSLPALTLLEDIPSDAPSALIEGVRVHSGDIVLTRGDSPTSALIARGNPFPGNFSHIALVHIDGDTGAATVVESLIERGAVHSPAAEFLKKGRHRLLLLRLRPDHPALQQDRLAAHRAAGAILDRVRASHVPYDFSMDWQDSARMFCSEIVHHAYRSAGIELWAYKSPLSSPGLVRWLGDMGVRHFTTIVPSDLEYDPKLAPVAEWRNPESLRQDRLDNITLDVLLEAAERGDRLGYSPLAYLPGGLVKLWSKTKSALGAPPVIPDGMALDTALRVRSLIKDVHPRLRTAIARTDEYFRSERGYPAPYWSLTDLARLVLAGLRDELAPGLTGVAGTH